MSKDNEDGQEFSLVQSFYIDTDAYSDRDRLMFCAGAEFEQLRQDFHPDKLGGATFGTTIHRENESRVRMMAGKMGVDVTIQPCPADLDPDGSWSYLRYQAKDSQ